MPRLLLIAAMLLGGPRDEPPAPADKPEPAPAAAQEALPEANVDLKDGTRHSGLIREETAEQITLLVRGISLVIDKSRVARIERLPPLEVQYGQFLAAIDPKDADALVRLAEWLRERRQLDAALREVARALKADPTHGRALDLQRIITKEKELEAERRSPKPAKGTAPDAPKPAAPAKQAFGPPLLDDAAINLIKIYEIDIADPPRLSLAPGLIDTILEKYRNDPQVPATAEAQQLLRRAKPVEVLDLLFKIRARELYSEVKVLDHPRAMREFRDGINTKWLAGSCATAECHGGQDAGRLMLSPARTDAGAYTNFYILDRYRTNAGKPLLDLEDPAMSAVLQAAINPKLARTPHPEVKGYRPAMRDADDPRFTDSVKWLRGLYRPREGYPIKYTPAKPLVPPPTGSTQPR